MPLGIRRSTDRIAQIVNGDVDLVDADETFAMIYQMIADRRGS